MGQDLFWCQLFLAHETDWSRRCGVVSEAGNLVTLLVTCLCVDLDVDDLVVTSLCVVWMVVTWWSRLSMWYRCCWLCGHVSVCGIYVADSVVYVVGIDVADFAVTPLYVV